MHRTDHEAKITQLFGEPWTDVHVWLDQYFGNFGPIHRRLLHHQLGVELAVKLFGEGARGPAEQHIRDDLQLDDAEALPEDWGRYGVPVWNADWPRTSIDRSAEGGASEAIR
jgi:hypothetical protein